MDEADAIGAALQARRIGPASAWPGDAQLP